MPYPIELLPRKRILVTEVWPSDLRRALGYDKLTWVAEEIYDGLLIAGPWPWDCYPFFVFVGSESCC